MESYDCYSHPFLTLDETFSTDVQSVDMSLDNSNNPFLDDTIQVDPLPSFSVTNPFSPEYVSPFGGTIPLSPGYALTKSPLSALQSTAEVPTTALPVLPTQNPFHSGAVLPTQNQFHSGALLPTQNPLHSGAVLPTQNQFHSGAALPTPVSHASISEELRLKQEALDLGFTDQAAIVGYILGKLPQKTATSSPVHSPTLRLGKWNPTKESWEVFLHKFERYAEDFKWSEETKLLQMMSCLEGKPLEIYHRLDSDSFATYEKLKRELGSAFSLTADQLGSNFNSAMKGSDETATQFAANLKAKFLSWFKKANDGLAMTKESLLNHILREQFYKSLPKELRQQVKQHRLLSLEEIATYAENYFEARQPMQDATKAQSAGAKLPKPVAAKDQESKSSVPRDYRCRRCRTDAHHYKQCPIPRSVAAATAVSPNGSDSKDTVTHKPQKLSSHQGEKVKEVPL